ncbi:MAG: hypothetical protein GY787_27330 [Alteromonadales bacterium]|nr:hypothetical protein [Alteromonadales bacterium]
MRNLSTKIMTKIYYKHIISLLFIMLIGYSSPLYAQTVSYVDSNVLSNWPNAFTNIQDAINAVPGVWNCGNGNRPVDQIWVAAGTYTPIVIDKNVSIYGGFVGGETQLDQRNPGINVTIIDGSNTTRCVEITAFCEISGFVIENGYASSGGGVYIDYDPVQCPQDGGFYSPYIIHCKIRHNVASSYGGGLYAVGCDPNILVCNFYQNEAAISGGACFFTDSSPKIKRCKFIENESIVSSGGAIYADLYNHSTEYNPKIVNCIFRGNETQVSGGGIFSYQWYPAIRNCTFRDNSASSGGAFYGQPTGEAPDIRNSIFWNDFPDEIDINPDQDYTISHCDIEGGFVGGADCIDCVDNINDDPNFVSSGNSHLTLGSPCIDSGYDDRAPDIDLNRYPRPLDGDGDYILEHDMGAFEFPDQS